LGLTTFMTSQYDLLCQMLSICDDLVDYAKRLNESSIRSTQKEIEDLQDQQKRLVSSFCELDTQLAQNPPGAEAALLQALREKVNAQLAIFQSLNLQFFEHIKEHLELIGFQPPPDTPDLKDIVE
jgi:hypothetical protein